MIFYGAIKQLEKLCDMEMDIYKYGPLPPIMMDNDQTEKIRIINDTQRYIVKEMAKALNIGIKDENT